MPDGTFVSHILCSNPRLNDSLVFVFARLCYESNFPLLDFLTQCGNREFRKKEGGTEQVNVFAYVLSSWAETHASFDTPYHVKMRCATNTAGLLLCQISAWYFSSS